MNYYILKIKPLSFFGSLPKGDTIFGRICWQIFYEYGEDRLKSLLADYENSPFMVCSTFYPLKDDVLYLKSPSIPLNKLYSQEDLSKGNIKDFKRKKWFKLKLSNLKDLKEVKLEKSSFLSDKELMEEGIIILDYRYTHNTINRLTGTTGDRDEKDSMFSPFDEVYKFYSCNLCFIVALDETRFQINELKKLLEDVGKLGFGKDSSIGYGKFELSREPENPEKIEISVSKGYLYALSPFVPKKEDKDKIKIYFSPFIRYGKHGEFLAKQENSVKKAIIMADEGSVIWDEKNNINEPIYGKGIKNISEVQKEAVAQGYSIFIPIKVGV